MKYITHYLKKYFISGLLFIIPIWILYVVIKSIAGLVTDAIEMNVFMAFVCAVAGITLLGYLVRHVFKRHIKRRITHWAERPGIVGMICRTVSEFDEVGDKAREAFNNPILYKVDDGIYKLGFITDKDMDVLGLDEGSASEASPDSDAVWVYAPLPVTMTGELILIEQRKIQHIPQEQKESIPLFIMTAGLIEKTTS